MNTVKLLAHNIKTLRLQQKLSLRHVAKEVGVCFTTIHAWEEGRKQPRIEHLERFCKVFEVTIGDLWSKTF